MACRGFLEILLKLLNFLSTLLGLAMVGYGIYLFVEYKNASSSDPGIASPSDQMIQLGRPLMMAVSLSSSSFDNFPKAWFIYLFVGFGVTVFIISCFGCIGAATRNGCCLSCYGLGTSEFTYNPSESNRYPQAAPQKTEEGCRCIIV